jgi:diguanylate cyclase (GGDEF)-like protein
VAYYPLIPPGEHRFQVIAANEDGVWNRAGAELAFTAEPGLERTPWPYLVAAAIAVLAVWLTIRRRTRAARLRQSVLEREVRIRTEELLETKQELEEANRILQQLAVEDPLTGIANRRAFEERLDQEWRRAAREGHPLGVLMLDVDRFKAYNDALGHSKGDECLIRVAHALAGSLRRAGDLLARYGGEEFAAILPDTDTEELANLAETLRREIERLDIPHPGSSVSDRVTVSLGGASTVPTHHDDSAHLVRTADRALYEAKRAGKNRSRVRRLVPDEAAEE